MSVLEHVDLQSLTRDRDGDQHRVVTMAAELMPEALLIH